MSHQLKSLKPNPHLYLSESEIYLQNFWQPKKGHKIIYDKVEYEIKEIIEDAQAKCKNRREIVWLQDAAWKPTLEDVDAIVQTNGGEINGNLICVPVSGGKRSYFQRPNSLSEYEQIIRQIRLYTKIHGGS